MGVCALCQGSLLISQVVLSTVDVPFSGLACEALGSKLGRHNVDCNRVPPEGRHRRFLCLAGFINHTRLRGVSLCFKL